MSKTTIVANSHITLEYLSDKKLLFHTVHQPVSERPDLFIDALNKGTVALKEYGLCKWLSDDRKNGPLSQDILDWAISGWYIKTISAGWKYWANIVPQEMPAAGTLMPVIDQLSKQGLKMHLFTDLDAAFSWLDSIDPS